MHFYDTSNISINSYQNKKYFRTKFVENIKTQTLCAVTFYFSEIRAVYEIVWKNYEIARQATDGNVMLCRKIALCMLDNQGKTTNTNTKAHTHTHIQYVILTALLLQ